MKIFYIGGFLRSWSTENYVSYALEQNGVKVIKRVFTTTGNLESYKGQITKHAPDVVLFSKASSPIFTELIEWCREQNILTVCWLWDLFWGYRSQRPPQFLCDLLFTTDGGHVEQWKAFGANHQVLRQGIHEPEHMLYDQTPELDIAFVGSPFTYSHRKSLVNWLRVSYGTGFKCYSGTRELELNRVLANTKIVVGDSYPSENYWSNRVYEILGRGGFLLFPETIGLEEEFTAGVHYVSYHRDSYKELSEIIRYYLSHDKEREQIRKAGFKKCGEYTYTMRARVLLEEIERFKKECQPIPSLSLEQVALEPSS